MKDRYPVPRVAAVHDLSGFGRSSLTVVIPVLSTMGIQVCPVPTAVLSTHSGFNGYTYSDLTPTLPSYLDHWKSLDLEFEGIYSGFLGSPDQADSVLRLMKEFSGPETVKVVDPVMGDDGKLYRSVPKTMISQMRRLAACADVVTPNYTELCLLLEKEPKKNISWRELKEMLKRTVDMGPRIAVVTSAPDKDAPSAVIAYDREDGRFWRVNCTYLPAAYPGTGDAFASVLTGSLIQNDSLPMALDRAVQFVQMAVRTSFGHTYPNREGVVFEKVLDTLKAPVTLSTYEVAE